MFVLVILIYLLIAYIELTPLYRNKKVKELILSSILITSAFVISLLLSLGVKVPSPAKPIEKIVLFVLGKSE